ncbi:toprim domain-containing protein [Oceanospirillum linum]|uniref:Toprim domain-containing protein n=1 Tax=Oceanospirillum linum TaxID=966 RepID=A0A1T1H8U7_OCELI|nr:toprim domain-containing protein [Oceanospirillum linum]OOV86196.1 hypothetical protein BTA35_0214550 [Oceanospirillum linum]SEG38435.1 putative DNA primase/helicase [Oleiphilus messinensis]SMP32103.1 putative DNA primase/helicase [Oceanospirillum linum]
MNKRQQQPPTAVQVIEAFKAAMLRSMGAAPDTIDLNDHTRFDDPEGKRGNKACYCRLYLDQYPAGYFGNYRTGYHENWAYGSKGGRLSFREQEELKRHIREQREAREAEDRAKHSAAQWEAASITEALIPADPEHPYLLAKGLSLPRKLEGPPFLIGAGGAARLVGVVPGQMPADHLNRLFLPFVDVDGALWGLQAIFPDGSKRFTKGCRKTEHFIPVQMPPTAPATLICEGWATGKTLAQGYPKARVLAAMDAGNLEPVAVAAREKWPGSRLVICGDDDRQKEVNTGAIAAREAAIASGAELALPDWPADAPEHLSDFNDLSNWINAGGRYAS